MCGEAATRSGVRSATGARCRNVSTRTSAESAAAAMHSPSLCAPSSELSEASRYSRLSVYSVDEIGLNVCNVYQKFSINAFVIFVNICYFNKRFSREM